MCYFFAAVRIVHIILFPLLYLSALADETLRTIAEVRELTPEQASAEPLVDITAQVTSFAQNLHGGFLHDGSAGIYLDLRVNSTARQAIAAGDIVRVRGVANPGLYMPHIRSHDVTRIDRQPLPSPVQLTDENLNSPSIDSQYVKVACFITSLRQDDQLIWANGYVNDLPITLRFVDQEGLYDRLVSLIHRRVLVLGIAATNANSRRQLTLRFVQVSSIERIDPADNAIVTVPFDELLKKDSPTGALARFRGIVLLCEGRQLVLRRADSSVAITLPLAQDIMIGSTVEAVGIPRASDFAPEILASDVRIISPPSEAPAVIPFPTNAPKFHSDLDNELVTLEAEISSARELSDEVLFQARSGEHDFIATLSDHSRHNLPELIGARVRLTGVASLSAVNTPDQLSERFALKLRSAADIDIIEPPSWLTSERSRIIAQIIAAIAIVALIWAITLRRTVRRQTEVISRQIEKEATMQERQRVARELHDTLQQNMTAVTMQLDTVDHHSRQADSAGTAAALGRMRDMLSEARQETRIAITRLRSEELPPAPIHELLQVALHSDAELAHIDLVVTATGQPTILEEQKSRHVLQICKEVFTNALRHSGASRITMDFHYRRKTLKVIISDDGRGFDTTEKLPHGHFGIIGMRERCKQIGADLEIQSTLWKGTQIILSTPLT